MNQTTNFNRLFGIWDYPTHIKNLTPDDVFSEWADILRLFDKITSYNYTGAEKIPGFRSNGWSTLKESYTEIKNAIQNMSSVNDLSSLAIKIVDRFILAESLSNDRKLYNYLFSSNNPYDDKEQQQIIHSCRKSIKKYLWLITAYEESIVKPNFFKAVPSKKERKLSDSQSFEIVNTLQRKGKFLLKSLLKSECDTSNIKNAIASITGEIRDNQRAKINSTFIYNAHDIYALVFGNNLDNGNDTLYCDSIYDLILTSAFIATKSKNNPYSYISDTITDNSISLEELFKNFESKKLYKFLNFFSLRQLTKFLFYNEKDYSFFNILNYFIERFTQINFINQLSSSLEMIEPNYRPNYLVTLSSCPLIEFRLFIVKMICNKLRNGTGNKQKIFDTGYDLVDSIHFLTFLYLPFLQYIFRVLLSIYYISHDEKFPQNESISDASQKISLVSYDDTNQTRRFKPLYKYTGSDEDLWHQTALASYLITYESLTLYAPIHFIDLIFFSYQQQFDYMKSLARGISFTSLYYSIKSSLDKKSCLENIFQQPSLYQVY